MKTLSTQRHALWQSHIMQSRSSGQTQTEYCRQHDLKPHQFIYWRNKLKKQENAGENEETNNARSGFVPVLVEPHAQPALVLCLLNGLRLEGINTATLPLVPRLIEVLT